MTVYVWKIGVCNDDVCFQQPAIYQSYTAHAVVLGLNLLNRCIKQKIRPPTFRDFLEHFHHPVHAPHGIPNTIRQLSVLHHGEGCWCLEGAQPKVQILERESRLEIRIVEIPADIPVVVDERFEPK